MLPEILTDTCEAGHQVAVSIDQDGNVKVRGGLADDTRASHQIGACSFCRQKGQLLARRYRAERARG